MLSNSKQNVKRELVPMRVSFDADALRRGLAPISALQIFCTWTREPDPLRPDKPKKIPRVRGGRVLKGSYADPALQATLMPLDDAINACIEQGHAGVGLAFMPGGGVVGLDLDHCIDENGSLSFTQAQTNALKLFGGRRTFIERSQSGTGLHAIALGDAPTIKANGEIEMFGDKNFIALTGSMGRGIASPVPEEDLRAVAQLINDIKGKAKARDAGNSEQLSAPTPPLTGHDLVINADIAKRCDEPLDPERAKSALAAIPSPDDRDDWVKLVLAFCAAGGDPDTMIAHSWPDSEDQIRELFSSYDPHRPGGIGPGTLYKLAMNAGWVPPARQQPINGVACEASDNQDAQPTDIWLAKQFALQYAVSFRFDHALKVWRLWRCGSWSLCRKGEQVEAAKHLANWLMGEAAKEFRRNSESKRTKKLMACALRAQSSNGIDSGLKLAQSDPLIAISAEDFDKDPDLFNTVNGVVHLPTGELRPHDPALLLYRQSPVPFDPDAKCPQFEAFMLQISCGDPDWVDYMQRVCGYALSGHVIEEKLFFMLGIGANGKSVFGNLLLYVLGSYGGVAPAAFLMYRRGGDANGPTPDILNLSGKRMVAANEVEAGSTMSGQTVKTTTSTELITARALHGAPCTFKPTHKLFIRGNHRPIINDNDEGIWRRIDLIPFNLNLAPEERDQGLEARLMNEAPGILAWMVQGFQKWQRVGLRPARKVRDASLAYRRESDLLAQWMDDCCVSGQDAAGVFTTPQQHAYASYRLWCHDQGLRQFSKKSFTRGLVEQGVKEGRQGSGQRLATYVGFRLTGS